MVREVYAGIGVLFLSFFLVGCGNSVLEESPNSETSNQDKDDNSHEEESDDMDIFDFYYINQAPKATEKHPLDELIKIYLSTKSIAIDVGNNELYEKPRFSTNGVAIFEDPLPFDDRGGLLKILEKYNVQAWEENYTTADPDEYDDGYGWMMLLQFEDGTIERYQGKGPDKEDVVPENFDDFTEEMEAFKNEKMKEATQ